MAKRHYDMALETNSEAYIPVLLSLGKLYARSIWHTLMGGTGGLNIWTEEETRESLVLFVSPTICNAFEAMLNQKDERPRIEEAPATQQGGVEEQEHHTYNDDEEGGWYLGKAKDEFHRRRGMEVPDRDEDPVQVSADTNNADKD